MLSQLCEYVHSGSAVGSMPQKRAGFSFYAGPWGSVGGEEGSMGSLSKIILGSTDFSTIRRNLQARYLNSLDPS